MILFEIYGWERWIGGLVLKRWAGLEWNGTRATKEGGRGWNVSKQWDEQDGQ